MKWRNCTLDISRSIWANFLQVLRRSIRAGKTCWLCWLQACLHYRSRVTVLFFALSGLDLFNELDSLDQGSRKKLIEWIYFYHLSPTDDTHHKGLALLSLSLMIVIMEFVILEGKFGFSTADGLKDYGCCNVALTYCALASLVILGDDLSRVDRKAILQGLKSYQKDTGKWVFYLERHSISQLFAFQFHPSSNRRRRWFANCV